MSSFDFLWRMLDEHGVIERYKGDCARLWDTFSLDQQRAIFAAIRSDIRTGKFVNYNPVKAVRDHAPKAAPPMTLSFSEYYAKYGTTAETDGWHMENPTGNQVIYIKNN